MSSLTKHLNLYTFLSLVSGGKNVRRDVAEAAYRDFDNVTGRFDHVDRVLTRRLHDVAKDDEDVLRDLGAKQDEKGWYVPDNVALTDDFTLWGKPVPADVVYKSPRMTSTKDGRVVEGYKLIEDELKGTDSTALPLMYAGLAVLSCVALVLSDWAWWLAAIPAVLMVPYLNAINKSEGVGEGIRAFVIAVVMPLMMLKTGAVNIGPDMLSGGLGGLGKLLGLGGAWILMMGALGGSTTGGFWGWARSAFKWSALMVAVLVGNAILLGVVPGWSLFQGVVAFLIPALYPVIYSERDYVERAEREQYQHKMFNLAEKGSLANAHVSIRMEQAVAAANDETPLLHMGEADGYLTNKGYGFAPDRKQAIAMSLNDLTMHYLVFGATGKGKTASKMRPMAAEIMKLRGTNWQTGMYVDCGKGSLAGDLEGVLDIVVKPNVPFAYYEGLNPTTAGIALNTKTMKDAKGSGKDQIWINGAKMLINHILTLQWALVEHEKEQKALARDHMKQLYSVMSIANARLATAEGADKAELEQQLDELNAHYAEWKESATSERQWYWNVECTERLRQLIDMPRMVDGVMTAGEKMTELLHYLGYGASEERKLSAPRSIHPEIGQGFLLDTSIEYALRAWPMTEDGQRSSFMINAKDVLFPLMRGAKLVDEHGTPWYKLETGVRPEECLYGKNVGVALPRHEHGDAGLLVSSLVKQRIYTGINRRLSMAEADWRAEGQTPVVLLWDEVQDLVSDDDIALLPKARSGWVMAYFATQGFDSLVNAFGSVDAAKLFCNTFQSVDSLESSPETYEYLSNRFGTALMTVFESHALGIDYDGAVRKYLTSPFNNPDHPEYAAMKKLERAGAARFSLPVFKLMGITMGVINTWGMKQGRMSESDVGMGFMADIGGKKEIQPIFKPEEFSALLRGRGKSIAWHQRAGTPRVDLIRFGHLGPDALRKTTIATQQQGA